MIPTNNWQLLIRRTSNGYVLVKQGSENPEFLYEEVIAEACDRSDLEALLREVMSYFGENLLTLKLEDRNDER